MHSHHHEHEGQHGGHESQLCGVNPLTWSDEHLQRAARGKGYAKDGDESEEQHVERKFYGGKAQVRLVDQDDVNGVAQRGQHHKCDAEDGERRTVAGFIKQRNACKREEYGDDGGGGDLLAEEGCHNYCHHYWIDEKKGGCYTYIHVIETDIECSGRRSHEDAERDKCEQLTTCERKGAALY